MRTITTSILLFFLLSLGFNAKAQKSIMDTTKKMWIFSPEYALQVPGADMADRFGTSSSIGLEVAYKSRSNFQFSVEGNFLFGNQVKNKGSLLQWAKTSDGNIITREGGHAVVDLFERGFTTTLNVGKLLPIIGPNPNSGLLIRAGAGYMQHNIRVEFDNGEVPQLNDSYEPYYDREVNGPVIKEFIGYRHLSNNRLINFFIGIELQQAFTSTTREYNVDAGKKIDKSRLDLLHGIRVGWSLPIYRRAPDEYYYY